MAENLSPIEFDSRAAISPAGSEADAQALYSGNKPETLNIFIYENLDKDVEYQKEKTFEEILEGGGIIAHVILGLGVFGLLMLLARVFFLLMAGSNVKQITQLVYAKIESGHGGEAYNSIKNLKGSTARVIRATLRNISRDREHIEDIITENILNENRVLDRFGNFILVTTAMESREAFDALLKEGVIVRPMAGYGYPNSFRVSTGLPEENQRFIKALEKVIGGVEGQG